MHIQQVITALSDYSLSGVWHLLRDWGLRYKRGRSYVHSPDPEYDHKCVLIKAALAEADSAPQRVIALYLDELTYYRQPSVASDWAASGSQYQPLARYAYAANRMSRVVGALNALTGQVTYSQAAHVGVRELRAFYGQLRASYPEAEGIYAIQDNWPIHFEARVVAAAQAAGVTMLRLPTYAPWLNPIEKLWRKLKQEVLHLHRLGDQWETLKQRVSTFLDGFASGSSSLLRYVGLLPD
jgi:DDE superfamily endonuclease